MVHYLSGNDSISYPKNALSVGLQMNAITVFRLIFFGYNKLTNNRGVMNTSFAFELQNYYRSLQKARPISIDTWADSVVLPKKQHQAA